MLIPGVILTVLLVGVLGLWIHAVRRFRRSTVFVGGWRWAWLAILVLAPVLGPIIFLSALHHAERCSEPQPGRLAQLLKRGS